jgi:integrase
MAATSKKGQNRGGKWSWTDTERQVLLTKSGEFDQALIGPGCFWGYRISELLSLRVDDVMDARGNLRAFIMVPSERLKGGKKPAKHKVYVAPDGHVEGCMCKECRLASGALTPKVRHAPDDRKVPMGAAAPYVTARLSALAKARKRDGVLAHLFGQQIYLFESRKRGKAGQSKPISRQQAWHRLHVLMVGAGINPYLHGTHVLRKSSAAAMMKLSRDITVVRDWLGHRDSGTTDKYLKSDERARLIMAEAMGEAMLGAAA